MVERADLNYFLSWLVHATWIDRMVMLMNRCSVCFTMSVFVYTNFVFLLRFAIKKNKFSVIPRYINTLGYWAGKSIRPLEWIVHKWWMHETFYPRLNANISCTCSFKHTNKQYMCWKKQFYFPSDGLHFITMFVFRINTFKSYWNWPPFVIKNDNNCG